MSAHTASPPVQRLPSPRAAMNTILTLAALEIAHLANDTRGAAGMLPSATARVLEAMAGGVASEVSEAVKGWIFELRCANSEGLR